MDLERVLPNVWMDKECRGEGSRAWENEKRPFLGGRRSGHGAEFLPDQAVTRFPGPRERS